MLRLPHLLWVLLLVGAFVVLDDGRAEATTGLASWYGPGFEGAPTASGDVFDPNAFTAAHKTLPFGTRLTVSYGGRSAQVVVNDRGPYAGGRDLDLSQGAAEYLGLTRAGVDYVDYTVIGGGYGAARSVGYGVRRATGYTARQAAGYGVRQTAGYGRRDAVGLHRDTRGPRLASNRIGGPRLASGHVRGHRLAAGGLGGHKLAAGRAAVGEGSYYVVRPGDTLWDLSGQLGTTVHRLASSNGIANPDYIQVGQRIYY